MQTTPSKDTQKSSLKWLFQKAQAARSFILLSILLGFFGGLLLIVQARLMAGIVHGAFMGGQARSDLLPLFISLAAIFALRALIVWGRESIGFQAGARVRTEIRQQLLEHISQQGPAYISNQHSGALTTVALEHVERLHDFFAHYLPQLALAALLPLSILAFVFPLSWAAGALFLFTAPLIPLFMILVGMGAETISQRHHQSLARMSAHFLDVLQGLTTLKLFNRSRSESQNIARVSSAYRRRTMGVLRIAFLSSAVLEFFSSISIALVAVYLGMSYLGYIDFGRYGETLSFSAGFFILLLAPDFYFPLRELGTYYHARAEAVGAAQEIRQVMTATEPKRREKRPTHVPATPFPIQFKSVELSYDGGQRPVLKGVDFMLDAGEQVALVGPSGAGKTSILNLLLGFLVPDQGRIQIGEAALRDIHPSHWLANIGWIGQHPMLFHGTILDNIQMGRMDASMADIEAAAQKAGVTAFTSQLPQGLETPVGERGMGLSRGQAQRVALARAFLKNAPLLLLDEPTAGLDIKNERLVLKALEALSHKKTLLLLTHRLANLEKMDRIMVLTDGRIQENGSYQKLIQNRGLFYQLVQRARGVQTDANLA
jgi:ATP-binding cassette subfamily C protein CydD